MICARLSNTRKHSFDRKCAIVDIGRKQIGLLGREIGKRQCDLNRGRCVLCVEVVDSYLGGAIVKHLQGPKK